MLRVSLQRPSSSISKVCSIFTVFTASYHCCSRWHFATICFCDHSDRSPEKGSTGNSNFFNYCVPFWKQTSGFCPCDYNIQDCDTCTTLDCQIREWISEALLMYPNIAKRKPQFTCLIWHCTFECCWLFSTFELKFEEEASAASFFVPDRLFLLEVSLVSCS